MRRRWILIGWAFPKTTGTKGDQKSLSRGGWGQKRTRAKSRPAGSGRHGPCFFSKTDVPQYCSFKLEKKTSNIYKWKEKVQRNTSRRPKVQVTKATFKGIHRFVFFTAESLPCSETQPSKGPFTCYRNDFHSRTSSFHPHIFLCICLHDTETKFRPHTSHSGFQSKWNSRSGMIFRSGIM